VTPILLRTQTDARLLSLAASGHDRAFEAIVERYRKPLMRYLRRLLSEPLAEDVLQATFLNAWRALEAGTDVRELRPWLYRIGHNQAINALKRASAALEPLPDGGSLALVDLGPDHEIERRDEMRLALAGVAALPDRQRTALLAVAVEGRAHADVARELGLSDGAVRQLVHRARSSLRAVATAITPAPFVDAVASSHDVTAARIAELAAGAGSAGVAGFAMKAGAVAVTAGAVVAGVPKHDAVNHHRPAPKVAAAHPSRSHHATGAVVAAKHDLASAATATHRASSHRSSAARHSGHGGSGRSGHSGRSGGSGRSGRSERSGHHGRGEGSRHGGVAPVVTSTSHHRSGRDDGGSSGRGGGGGDDVDVVASVHHEDAGETSGGGGDHHGGGGHDERMTITGVAADDKPSGKSDDHTQADAVPTTTATTNEVPRPDPLPSGGGSGGSGGGDDATSGGSGG
jgi:RNA polymerase sigma factor (sigma-70 family)